MNVSQLADEYLTLRVEQAQLANKMKDLKEKIVLTGVAELVGTYSRLVVSHTAAGLTFDSAKAKTFLSEAAIAECQKPRKGATQFRCFALKVDSAI